MIAATSILLILCACLPLIAALPLIRGWRNPPVPKTRHKE